MDGGDSEENAAVYTNPVKGNVDSGSTENPTTPSTENDRPSHWRKSKPTGGP